MSTEFWIITIVMALLAYSFIAPPLIKYGRRIWIVSLAVALPVFASGFYWSVGSPRAAGLAAPERLPMQRDTNGVAYKPTSVGTVASLVDGLAARLQDNPDDGESWLLLARSYKHLNRGQEAQVAFEKAAALGEYDMELATLSAPPAVEASAPAQVFGNVRLSERSKEIVLPTDTVFIFARAVDGPPMPLAVLQRPASDLPLDFLLNDSQAMSADMKLSSAERVVVTARISRSGVATDALQGLEARSDSIAVADNWHLNLIIK